MEINSFVLLIIDVEDSNSDLLHHHPSPLGLSPFISQTFQRLKDEQFDHPSLNNKISRLS